MPLLIKNGVFVPSEDCADIADVLQRVGDKWSLLIVMILGEKPMRFNELKRAIGGISQRMLTLNLRGLERDGLVRREVIPSLPPRVEYALTDMGLSLCDPVSALAYWTRGHLRQIAESRRTYDSAISS